MANYPVEYPSANDLPILRAYLGDVQFNNTMRAYFSHGSSGTTNRPWHIFHLPKFLQTHLAFKYRPEISELACLELAFQKAFVAPAGVEKSDRPMLHPSVSKLVFGQNTTSIWSALQCNAVPPRPHRLEQPQAVLVWRQSGAGRFRLLGHDEELQLNLLAQEASNSEHYLAGWLQSELVLPAAEREEISVK